MLSNEEYIRVSLEINLFFQRIMKEHLFFIEINLQPVVPNYIMKTKMLRQSFEQLLAETVYYANEVISEESIRSNEFVTPYTLKAEEVNSKLTGRDINTEITKDELKLVSNINYDYEEWFNKVSYLNTSSLNLLVELIAFQKELLSKVSECKIFINLYPEMLEHDTHEAEYYLEILRYLQIRSLPKKTLCEELNFWNHIMGEHAMFIDGMLDPTEKTLKESAQTIAEKFELLVEKCIKSAENQILKDSLKTTGGIRDYKIAAAKGLLQCEIKSIIPPLLADHVLREANHYLRMLKMLMISEGKS